jgi:hypothetical protein
MIRATFDQFVVNIARRAREHFVDFAARSSSRFASRQVSALSHRDMREQVSFDAMSRESTALRE